jgi:DNA-binding GntR family transcriptional regulator
MEPSTGTGIRRADMITRPALAVEVANALRELILEGELAGGEKIREKELTERFGVSRTPLREAMKMLSAEGLIELIPNRGAIISQSSEADLANAFPILAALEALAGAQAAERATEKELNEISALTDALHNAFTKRDRPRYFEINQAIHNAILDASRNPTLRRMHATLAGQVHRARYQANLEHARWEKAVAEHGRIAEALSDRRTDEVAALLRSHMMAKLASVLACRKQNGAT